jgi:TolB protein
VATKLILKYLMLAGALLCLVPGNVCRASDKVYLDVDSPVAKQFVIAIPDFRNSDGGKVSPDKQAALLADQLSSLLQITSFFNAVNKAAYLEDNRPPASLPAENIRFADWLAIGAEYLVQGSFQQRDGGLVLDCRLYDVVKAEVVVGKKYVGKAADGKIMLRKFAGEVLQALTGDGSVFSTRIAFVMKMGKATDILSINYDGSDLVKEVESKTVLMSPRWSPEGRYLGFTSFEAGNPDFYVKDMIKSIITKNSDFRGINLPGGWSPDGKKVLITLSKDGNEEIYLLDFGSKFMQRLTNNYAIDVSPAWSPDGSRIAFVSNRSGSPQIYIMDGDGNNVKRLTFTGNYNTSPAWSPKGDRIAYEGTVDGRFQILTIGTDGENPKQLTFDSGESKSPSWSPDGRYLVFSKNNNGEKKKIYTMTAAGSNVRLLYEGAGDGVSASWSPRLKAD